MLTFGLTWLSVSAAVFVAVLFLVQVEQRRGNRLFLSRFRAWLDRVIFTFEHWLSRTWNHFTKYILQLGWYYGIHSFLRAVMQTLIRFYERVESVFEANRDRAKRLRAEKHQASNPDSHLTEMAEHKVATRLTPTQQRKLRDTQLKGD